VAVIIELLSFREKTLRAGLTNLLPNIKSVAMWLAVAALPPFPATKTVPPLFRVFRIL
jgi:hypothetical protein